MKPLFCFIDDADFELENFRRFAAPAFAGVEMVYAKTFAEAQQNLDGRIPLCFLLDLYGTDPRVVSPQVPKQDELASFLGNNQPALDSVYQGLHGQGTEMGNLFLRRLYAQVDSWQRTFLFAAGILGQGLGFGLGNLQAVRAAFPWAAAVGYTRKSLFADAVNACQAGIDGLMQKPQGRSDDEIADATMAAGPELARATRQAVDRRLAHQVMPIALRLTQGQASKALATGLVECLKHLGVAELGEATAPARETINALGGNHLKDAGLARHELDTVRALSGWLEHR